MSDQTEPRRATPGELAKIGAAISFFGLLVGHFPDYSWGFIGYVLLCTVASAVIFYVGTILWRRTKRGA